MDDPASQADRRASAWVLPLLALAAVVLIWTQIRAGGIPEVDRLARSWAANHQRRVVFTKLNAIKDVGSSTFALPLLLVVAAVVAAVRRNIWPVAVTVLSVAGLAVSTVALKRLVARPGPSGVGPPAVEGAWPSGHATTVVVTMLVLVAISTGAARRPLKIAAVVLPVVVGLALVYCNHHWLCDVLVAAPLGYLIVRAATLVLPQPAWPIRTAQPRDLARSARPSTPSELR